MKKVDPLEEPQVAPPSARAWPPTGSEPVPPGAVPRTSIELCGVEITRITREGFLDLVGAALADRSTDPLLVGSVNLDHVHHFGRRGRRPTRCPALSTDPPWLLLADGAPISRRAATLTGEPWPRLTGADLLAPTLDLAAADGASVGFLGGTEQSVAALRDRLGQRWPDLDLAGCWTPSRAELTDPRASARIAAEVARAGVDVLVVGLGKPLQERWIDDHGVATGARVLAAFGGAADFLGGTSRRAPTWVQERGFEWLFRLSSEPRRLSRRYLVQGPPAMLRLLAQRPGTTRRREG